MAPAGTLNPPPNGFPASILNVDGNNFIGIDNTTAAIHMQANGNETIIQSDGGKLTIRGNIVNDAVSGSNPPAERNLILTGTATGEISGNITAGTSTQGVAVWKEGTGTWILSGSNDGSAVQYAGSAFWVHNGVLRLTNSNALGPSGSAGGVTVASSLYDEPTGVTTPATGRIELAGSITIPKAITLQGRPDATNAHLANYSDSNIISGNILLTQVSTNGANGNGSVYLIQSNTGSLTLAGIQNNSTIAGTRQVALQGNGSVTGAIGGGTSSTPNDISVATSGNWTLSGTNTYTGSTTINSGTLSLGSTGSIAGTSAINVASGAYFDVSGLGSAFTVGSGSSTQKLTGAGTVQTTANGIINGTNGYITAGGDGTAGTLSIQNKLALGSALSSTVKFDLADNNTPANNDLLEITGDLSIPGASTFSFYMMNNQLASATYKLIHYSGSKIGSVGSITPTGLGSGTTRQSFSLSDSTAHEIDLIVSGAPANLTWKGGLSSNTWDRTVLNWNNNTEKFYNLDIVTFDDSGSISPNINITTAVEPGNINFNNTTAKDYTFTGTGRISGNSGLTIGGGGKVILANSGVNDYTGSTQINSGTLQIGNGGANGSIGSNGVVINGGWRSINRAIMPLLLPPNSAAAAH